MGGLMSLSGILFSFLLIFIAVSHSVAAEPRPAAVQAPGILVFSIVPSQGEPGALVTVTGNAFTRGTTVLLGGNQVQSRVIDNRHLNFLVPDLPSGQYALSVRAEDGVARSYSFHIQPLRPVASSLEPDHLAACNPGNDRDITIRGKNFAESSQVMFNGAIIHSRYQSSESMLFAVPPVQGGLHQVAVRNGDSVSTPLGLSIITKPTISSVSIGSNHVNQYELIIDGYNFHQNSVVMADGVRIGGPMGVQEERIVVQSCSRIVYMRKPFSSSPRDINIQVLNPSGEASPSYIVTAP